MRLARRLSRSARSRRDLAPPLVAACALAIIVGCSVQFVGDVRAEPANSSQPVPTLGVGFSRIEPPAENAVGLLGAAAQGAPGEAWGFMNVVGSVPPPLIDGHRLEYFDDGGDNATSRPVFLRHTDATGWQIVETPLSSDGSTPIDKFTPLLASSAITPHGGGLVIGEIKSGSSVVLARDPGGRFGVRTPPPSVLLPAGGGEPAESVADFSAKRSAAAAFETGGKTAFFVAATGRKQEGVLYFDGDPAHGDGGWTREEIVPPGTSPGEVQVLAISATGPDNAWLLGRLADSAGQGIALFQRVASGGGATWVKRDLGDAFFERATTPADGVTGLRALSGTTVVGSQPLTVTTDGVWIDGRFTAGGDVHDFTLFYDSSASALAGTWCSALSLSSPCTHDFPFSFHPLGYRSTAWAGAGFGTRVITNVLDPASTGGTNRGSYLKLEDQSFVRMMGAGYEGLATSALSSDSSGWLSPAVKLSAGAPPQRIADWSVGTRAPLESIAAEPGKPPAALSSQALAVGENGAVARFVPGSGWVTEFLQSSTGLVRHPDLRAVAWPEAARAHAVGDYGAMWHWRGETGLWQPDPGAPIGLRNNLNSIAFNPFDSDDGVVVGDQGTLLEYGKSWQKVCPSGVRNYACGSRTLPAGFESEIFRSVAFAGREPLVAAGRELLVRRDGVWQVDPEVHALSEQYARRTSEKVVLMTVAGLPDGSAFIGGVGGFTLERDGAAGAWHAVEQPLANFAITGSALFREAGSLRAMVTVSPDITYTKQNDPIEMPGVPPPLLTPRVRPPDGYLLRETAGGWRDEQQQAYDGAGSEIDKAVKAEPLRAMLVDGNGEGWVAGGANGVRDAAARGGGGAATRVRTAFVGRYAQAPGTAQAGTATSAPVAQSSGTVNFVVGGHADCESPDCSQLANLQLGPDRQLIAAVGNAAAMARESNGPRFFLYTGGRHTSAPKASSLPAEESRFASLLGAAPSIPTFAATSDADTSGDSGAAFKNAFSGFGEPFGDGPAGAGITPRDSAPGTRTHYSFDSVGAAGRLRVIVIDNSLGSLVDSDPHQNPAVDAGGQFEWLRRELRAAKSDGTPAIVMGSRDLSSGAKLNGASDGTSVATLLRDEGASAYFFERPEENRRFNIPSGSSDSIPEFGTGTLGYRAEADDATGDKPSAYFGNAGTLLSAVNVAARNPVTNRAPVSVRMIPLIQELNLDAIDGTLLRRSQPALFTGLGRRIRAGDRWGADSGGGPQPAGSDPYLEFPTSLCKTSGCSTRIDPEFEFHSSDPDIADFVAFDPQSSNARKPLLDSNRKTVSDSSSGLLCAFNAGATTITVSSGGLSYARQVTVQDGSVQPPCGTRPLDPARFKAAGPPAAAAPPPPPPAAPPVALSLPVVPPPLLTPAQRAAPGPNPRALEPFLPPIEPVTVVPVVPPPPPPSLARPIPPTGGMARAPERQREDEAATEDSQAFARYEANQPPNVSYGLGGMILLAAIAAAAGTGSRRGRARSRPQPATVPIQQRPRLETRRTQ